MPLTTGLCHQRRGLRVGCHQRCGLRVGCHLINAVHQKTVLHAEQVNAAVYRNGIQMEMEVIEGKKRKEIGNYRLVKVRVLVCHCLPYLF